MNLKNYTYLFIVLVLPLASLVSSSSSYADTITGNTVEVVSFAGEGVGVGIGYESDDEASYLVVKDSNRRIIKVYPVGYSISTIGTNISISGLGHFSLENFHGKRVIDLLGSYFGSRTQIGWILGIRNNNFYNLRTRVSIVGTGSGPVIGTDISVGVLRLFPILESCNIPPEQRRSLESLIGDSSLFEGDSPKFSCNFLDIINNIAF